MHPIKSQSVHSLQGNPPPIDQAPRPISETSHTTSFWTSPFTWIRNQLPGRLIFWSNPDLHDAPPSAPWRQAVEKALQNTNSQKSFFSAPFSFFSNSLSALFFTPQEQPHIDTESLIKGLGDDYHEATEKVILEAGILPQSEDANKVRALAAQSLEPITQKLRASLERHPNSPRKAIQEAYKETLSAFYQLGNKVEPYYQKEPQIFLKSDGTCSVVSPASSVKNLVLSGGGTKGEAYVGFLTAVGASGTLQGLKAVAGSSAGAMTATFIAAGMSASEVKKAVGSMDLLNALVGKSKDPIISQELNSYLDHNSISVHQIGFAGSYLTEKMNQSIAGSIKSYLDSLSKEELEQKVNAIDGISDPDRQLINQLKEDLDSNKTHMITFGELALLQKMDPRFKELTVTAFDLHEQKEIYFNTETCPTMSIAIAATISAALPLAYRAKRDPNTGDTLVDGGIGSNVPTEYFAKEPQEKTLVLGFDDNGDFYNVVNGPPTITNKTIFSKTEESLEVFLRGNPQYQKDLEQDKQKLKNAGPNAFCIKHGELETISFTATPEQVAEAQRLAEIHTWEQLLLRQHQAVQHDYNSLDEAMEGMTITDLNLLIRDQKDTEIQKAAQKKLKQNISY